MLNLPDTKSSLNKAFTLSEVLIVIVVLGVIAMLTIITLSNSSYRKRIVTAVKTNFSVLNNAYELIVVNKDTPENWVLGEQLSQKEQNVHLANLFKPYLQVGIDCVGQTRDYTKSNCYRKIPEDSDLAYLVLANGFILGFKVLDPGCEDMSYFVNKRVCGEIDLLMDTRSTVYGKNVFQFFVTTSGVVPFGLDGAKQTFKLGCKPNQDTPYSPPFYKMSTCTAWVLSRENMDYLDCQDKLDWNASSECNK